jgi:hypothetical protein
VWQWQGRLFGLVAWGDKRRLINDIKDYIRVDDFYSKLIERDSYIRDKRNNTQDIDDIVLMKLNKKCLDLAEDALEKIDWSKYKGL